ncbi:hypothetical protein [Myroides sp. WP-1]|uniref:hypothetical protein n=1 Tax=Myroides sp. WP-1 TaxID=2759944 RepID=UPI0015FCB489|nr:hypothetical protein [Myroides sp. WP-1]MBB1139964.1 hypothetical protein [Myroides sp. WP-1]
MKKIIQFSLLVLSGLVSSCDSGTASYWMDNPTKETISVYIDEQVYEIPPQTKIAIDLEFGKHQMKYNDQVLNFHNGGRVNKSQAIINPTQSNYVFYKRLYIDQNDARSTDEFVEWAMRTQSDSLRLVVNDTVMTLFVPFQVSNKIFISKTDFDWKYNIDEPMPNQVDLSSPIVTRRNRQLLDDPNYQAGRFQETVYKIYREQDFLDFVHEVSEDRISFLLDKKPYAALPKTTITLTKDKEVEDETYRQAMDDHLKEFEKWLTMKGSKSTTGFKEFFFSQKLNGLRTKYLEQYPGDYSFNQATNELNEQLNVFMLYQLNIIE